MNHRRSLLVTAAAALAVAGWATPASADATYPPVGPTVAPSVQPTTIVRQQVQPAPDARPAGGLPFTGAEVAAMSFGGGALLAAGVVLVVVSRRRRPAQG